MEAAVPVVLDIVGSRDLPDRAHTQRQIHKAFEKIADRTHPLVPMWATVGDEFQVVYATIRDAIRATALVRLLAGDEFDVRFGIGRGAISTIEQGSAGPIEDGEGWYRAREALEQCTKLQAHGQPWLRTWAQGLASEEAVILLQGYLTMRDHVIGRMKAREKRIAAAWLMGASQEEIARQEKLSQPAVSMALAKSGGSSIIHAEKIFQELQQ